MSVRFVRTIVLSVSLIFLSGVAVADRASRLEDLMLWKMSDELRLTPDEEKKFADVVRELNRRKADLSRACDEAFAALKATKDAKARSKALARYRKSLESFHQIPLEELDRVKASIGEERFVQYVEVKKDMADKVKALLTEKAEKAEPLPPPKLIEGGK